MIQGTPNPNALKFVLNVPVKTEGNYTYKNAADCQDNPLAEALFKISENINEVYFFDNYVTITQDGNGDWDDLEDKIQNTITELIADHDPNFKIQEAVDSKPKGLTNQTPEISKINAILDDTVRPALQMDGGDIQLVNYENKILQVFYQGACGSCPSASMGTMKAIENILKDQFDPEISVELSETI